MPRLTAVSILNARPARARRELHDSACPGLYLVVQVTGHKSWALRYRVRGHNHKLTLGPVVTGRDAADDPALDTPLTLAAARELATKTLRQIRSGVDPAVAKRARHEAERVTSANTLRAISEEYLRREGETLRTLDQRQSDLDLLCSTSGLGALPLEQIKRSQFVRVFDAIADRGPVRAARVQNAAKRLLRWHANRSEYINVLADIEPRISIRERARTRVLSDDELKVVWTTAEKFPAPFGPYVRFVLLTACRRNEAGGLCRSELAVADIWVLPRARWKIGKKMKADLLIPLSGAAQAIITAQPESDEFIFGGGRPLGNFGNYKLAFDAASGIAERWTLHDLRRTARTLLSKCATPDTAERCLGHALPGQRGTYDRYEYQDEKRAAFEALAQRIELIVRPPPTAKVADLAAERKRLARG